MLLLSEYQSLTEKNRLRNETVKYNEVRLGFLDTCLNVIQSLHFDESDTDEMIVDESPRMQTQCHYNFDGGTESDKMLSQKVSSYYCGV
jgi:hypothetical protein